MPLRYQTGEEIQKGDNIRLSHDHGFVEFIVDPAIPNPTPEIAWFIREHGLGIMIHTTRLGSMFTNPEANEDLHFVSRAK